MTQQPYKVDAQGRLIVDASGQPQVQVPASWATVNEQPIESATPTTVGESFAAFGQGAKEMMDPRPLFSALYEQGPLEVVKGLGMAQQQQYEKARQAWREGRMSEALGYTAAWLMPLIGPAAATAGETIGTGEIARGTGQMAGLLAPFGSRTIGRQAASGLAQAGERLATKAERRLAHDITPQVGQNKARFATLAQRAAPTLAREPGMGAWTIDTLAQKIGEQHMGAQRLLDEAYAPIPKTRMYATGPLVARLNQLIKQYQLRGMGANAGTVDPANYADTLATLTRAREEAMGLGNLTNIDEFRKLVTAWQKGAEERYTPSVVQDAFKAKGRGIGWADAGSAAREYLVSKEPGTAAANARYSVMEAAREAIEAARETEFTRPARGRGYVSKLVGAGLGYGATGDAGGMVVGIATMLLLDRVSASVTGQIQLARVLAKVGDAFRAGKPQQAMALLQRHGESLGVTIPGVARAQGGPVAVPVAERPPTTGAPTIGPPDSRR